MKAHQILALLLLPSLAGAYQTELQGTVTRTDFEDDDELTEISLSAEYYFSPVDVKGHPLNEAAYLERTPSIEFAIGNSNIELSTGDDLDGPLYGANVTLMSKDQNYYLEAGFVFAEVESDTTPVVEIEFNTYHINPGIFVNDGTLVTFRFESSGAEALGEEVDTTVTGLEFKTVFDSLNIEGGVNLISADPSTTTEDFDNTEISLSGDYYIDQRVSIGAGFSTNSGDNLSDEGKTISLRSIIFASEKVGFGFEYERFSADRGVDDNNITVVGGVRF